MKRDGRLRAVRTSSSVTPPIQPTVNERVTPEGDTRVTPEGDTRITAS